MSYAANREQGIRASLCWSAESARLARSHNDANILVLPGRVAVMDPPEAILDAWLATPFSGDERHIRRIAKVDSWAVAIDGPAGAGKSTVARKVAERLGFLYVDTGAMYRAIALAATREGVDLENEDALADVARRHRLAFDDTGTKLFLDGEDVSAAIRTPETTAKTRFAARSRGVREILGERQREMAREQPVVMEGRDIGTVVLPDARWKYFLTASAEERARRRMKDFEAANHKAEFHRLLTDIQARDEADNAVGPIKVAYSLALAKKGIVHFDTTGLTFEQVVEQFVREVNASRSPEGA